jgi:hypothetical protein
MEEAAKEHHKDFFAADLVCQEELKKGNVMYSLLIGAVLFESLQIAPKAFLELLRPDWVAQLEGKCGATAPRRHPTRLLDYPHRPQRVRAGPTAIWPGLN